MKLCTGLLTRRINKHRRKLTTEFKEFALKGNVIDLAVGVIIGGAFQGIIKSFIDDIFMPPIGRLLRGMDFSNLFFVLSDTGHLDQSRLHSLGYLREQGVAVIAYGSFLSALINFFVMALMIFIVVKAINTLRRRALPPALDARSTKSCPLCCSEINIAAIRCPHCCAELEPPVEPDISE